MKNIYIYIYIYSIHILYIFYTKDCVVERDAAAGQPSHPAARPRAPGPSHWRRGPRAAGWMVWPGGWPAATSLSTTQSFV